MSVDIKRSTLSLRISRARIDCRRDDRGGLLGSLQLFSRSLSFLSITALAQPQQTGPFGSARRAQTHSGHFGSTPLFSKAIPRGVGRFAHPGLDAAVLRLKSDKTSVAVGGVLHVRVGDRDREERGQRTHARRRQHPCSSTAPLPRKPARGGDVAAPRLGRSLLRLCLLRRRAAVLTPALEVLGSSLGRLVERP